MDECERSCASVAVGGEGALGAILGKKGSVSSSDATPHIVGRDTEIFPRRLLCRSGRVALVWRRSNTGHNWNNWNSRERVLQVVL